MQMRKRIFSIDGIYARTMNFLWNLIVLSVLWVVCCIPVLTAGAATQAAYYTAAKVLRHKTGKLVQEFFSAFRRNFKQATCFTLCYALALAVLIIDCVYLYSNEAVPLPVLYLFYFMLLMVVANGTYLFPCISRFEMKAFPAFRMAVILSLRHVGKTFLLLLLFGAVVLGIYLMPWGILVFPGLGVYLKTFLMEPILLRYSPAPDADDPEQQKWYYHN